MAEPDAREARPGREEGRPGPAEPSERLYESLAETAGTLAWLLEDYLRFRFLHLILLFESPRSLQERLEEIAEDAAKDSFFYFCQLLYSFYSFQRKLSSSYRLGDSQGVNSLRRLYNTLVANLPQGRSSGAIDNYRILDWFEDQRVSTISFQRFRPDFETKGSALHDDFQAYRNWLRQGSPEVGIVAGALREYCLVLRSEAGRIEEVHRHGPGPVAGRSPRPEPAWSIDLRETALRAASLESALPRPLGRVTATGPSPPSQQQPTRGRRQRGGTSESSWDVRPELPRDVAGLLIKAYDSEDRMRSLAKKAGVDWEHVNRTGRNLTTLDSVLDIAWKMGRSERLLQEVSRDRTAVNIHAEVEKVLESFREELRQWQMRQP